MLASGSPRRADILRLLGLSFEVRPAAAEERLCRGETPAEAARRLAVEKALAVAPQPDELVLAADTIVALDGDILGKPESPDDALRMLLRLSGREHTVFTGLALSRGDRLEVGVAATSVRFRRLAHPESAEYVATGEPLDKAGAYGIQGLGAVLVEHIEGDYYNVMGLPVQLFLELLSRFGVRYAYGRLERS